MKKFILILFAVLSITSCKDEERVTLYEDMMFFTTELSQDNDYISPVTQLSADAISQLSLKVMRNAFAAKDYPQQNVQVIVDTKLSTAEQGVDFSIPETNLKFNGQNNTAIPMTVNIHSSTGKTLVLQLVYEYHKECPTENRKADRLKIKIK